MSAPTWRLHNPADRTRFWLRDPSHFPQPVSTACATLDLPAMEAGFIRAATELQRPLAGQYVRSLYGWVYFGMDLPAGVTASEHAEQRQAAILEPLGRSALDDWRTRHAPEARRITAEIRALARHEASDAEFLDHLADAAALRARQWHIHDLALVPAMAAASRYSDRWAKRLGGPVAAQALLAGFPHAATEAAEALDEVALAVSERPGLVAALLGAPPRTLDEAGVLPDGAWFVDRLRAYLDAYGHRAEGWDLGATTWLERPAPVFRLLAERLRRGPIQPGEQRRRAAEQRERAEAAAVSALPPEDRPAFLDDLRAAQGYAVVSEDHNAAIDQAGMAALRAVVLEAGRRLVAAGALTEPDSAVWLRPDEIATGLIHGSNLRRLVMARRAASRRHARLSPPGTLGAPLPDWAAGNTTLRRFFGLDNSPHASTERLRGTGVSAGQMSGRARLALSLSDADALAEGEILVCTTTSPAWTPALSLAAGIVTESGGILSHTAIVARELGIPCVTGVREATRRIPDGSRVQIDGLTGEVVVLSDLPV